MSSHFGHSLRISTFGESHGGAVGVVVDGCPPRVAFSEADIQRDLDRRRPGQSEIVTPRAEEDQCRILSGVFEGKTIGTPIAVVVFNKDARPEAYAEMETMFRPSHADYTYQAKFGIRNWQGGGRASARETTARVAAGACHRGTATTPSARQSHDWNTFGEAHACGAAPAVQCGHAGVCAHARRLRRRRVAVVTRGARKLGFDLSEDGAREIASRSRGTPRIAGRLLRRVRDFADDAQCRNARYAVSVTIP